jgi:tetratricopeptide (TPR) repeat protein
MSRARKATPKPAPPPSTVVRPHLAAALLFLLGVGLYANSLANEWALDDDLVYTEHAFVLKGWSGIPRILATDAYQGMWERFGSAPQLTGGRYRPLSLVTFAVEQAIFGLAPAVAHGVNVLLFGATLVAMYLLVLRLLPRTPDVALATAFLFAIHPVHTEVVANVKSRDEILSLLFVLLALAAALRSFDAPSRVTRASVPIFGFLACLSKEYGVLLVGLIPLMLVLFRSAPWGAALRAGVPMGGAAALYLAIRGGVVGFGSVESPELLNNPYLLATGEERLATKLFVLLKYLGLLLWPHPLASDYSYNQIPYRSFADPEVWVAILVHAGLAGAAVLTIRRRHPLGFALTVYLAPLLLVSNLLFDIGATMGERLLYHSSFGFALGVAWVAQRKLPRGALVALGIAALLLGGSQIVRRNPDWKNDDTLFLHDVTVVPNAALANANAGRAHLVLLEAATMPQERDRHLQEAFRLLNRAIELHPGFVDAWLHLAALYDWLGRADEMEAAWSNARRLLPQHPYFATYDPQFAAAFAAQGDEALAAGDAAAARGHLERALRFQPDLPGVWLSLGRACFDLGDAACARAAWERALALDPGRLEARTRLQDLSAPPDR